jgi:hypothetical protein
MKTRRLYLKELFSFSQRISKILPSLPLSTSGVNIEDSLSKISDMPDSLLFHEAMKLGIDPATLDRTHLEKVILQKMDGQKYSDSKYSH